MCKKSKYVSTLGIYQNRFVHLLIYLLLIVEEVGDSDVDEELDEEHAQEANSDEFEEEVFEGHGLGQPSTADGQKAVAVDSNPFRSQPSLSLPPLAASSFIDSETRQPHAGADRAPHSSVVTGWTAATKAPSSEGFGARAFDSGGSAAASRRLIAMNEDRKSDREYMLSDKGAGSGSEHDSISGLRDKVMKS
jgi:hypothetical protein